MLHTALNMPDIVRLKSLDDGRCFDLFVLIKCYKMAGQLISAVNNLSFELE